MSMRRRVRICRTEAEDLLATGVGGPEALSTLLAAVTPPPAVGEIVGERAALVEFRAAQLTTVPSRRRYSMLKTVLANAAAAKVALSAAAAAAATGGIAIAAATGNLPGTAQGPDHANPAASATFSTGAPSSGAAGSESAEPSSEASEGAGGSAAPSPSLSGLCTAFQAGVADNPGKALENPAFSVLVAAAGGKDNVASWCDTLVGAASTHPDATDHPGGAPADHPNATNHPTGAPTEHPTGAPSSPGRP
jgi:hypothetical protein